MAKITELPAVVTPAGTDALPIVQDVATTPVTKQMTLDQIASHVNNSNPTTTVSSSQPTGGSDGDIWYVI